VYKIGAWKQDYTTQVKNSFHKRGGLRPPPTNEPGRSAAHPFGFVLWSRASGSFFDFAFKHLIYIHLCVSGNPRKLDA
jgi:hypothetical protein